MGILKRRWIWLKRFRHRRGYGVHSPFAFNFITYVVYERGAYYAYRELKKKYGGGVWTGDAYALKCRKLLFRLANYVHPKVILLYGEVGKEVEAYLKAGCSSAAMYRLQIEGRKENSGPEECGPADKLIYVHDKVSPLWWAGIIAQCTTDTSMCILKGIHGSEEARKTWETVCHMPQVGVTFDLYDYGILFFDKTKLKQHYIVNFN